MRYICVKSQYTVKYLNFSILWSMDEAKILHVNSSESSSVVTWRPIKGWVLLEDVQGASLLCQLSFVRNDIRPRTVATKYIFDLCYAKPANTKQDRQHKVDHWTPESRSGLLGSSATKTVQTFSSHLHSYFHCGWHFYLPSVLLHWQDVFFICISINITSGPPTAGRRCCCLHSCIQNLAILLSRIDWTARTAC